MQAHQQSMPESLNSRLAFIQIVPSAVRPGMCQERLLVLLLGAAMAANVAAEDRVQFNRDVRPLLSDKCFFCHGPDAKKRQAELRLDERNAAVTARAIVVGQPEKSELIRRVASADADERMPPDSSKLGRLTTQEIDTLQRWIWQSAEYESHWSFVPLNYSGEKFSLGNAIDRFVAAGLADASSLCSRKPTVRR